MARVSLTQDMRYVLFKAITKQKILEINASENPRILEIFSRLTVLRYSSSRMNALHILRVKMVGCAGQEYLTYLGLLQKERQNEAEWDCENQVGENEGDIQAHKSR